MQEDYIVQVVNHNNKHWTILVRCGLQLIYGNIHTAKQWVDAAKKILCHLDPLGNRKDQVYLVNKFK